MQLQKSTDLVYAIRILHYLHACKDGTSTAQRISDAVCMPDSQFTKIADQLKAKGLITSVQGQYEGYQIAKSAHRVTVYDVFLAIEGELCLNHCLKEESACNRNVVSCDVQGYFESVQDALVKVLSEKYIVTFDMAWQLT